MNAHDSATATTAKPSKSSKATLAISNAKDSLYSLQFKQQRHDEIYNANLCALSKKARVTHYALQLSKFAGEMAEAMVAAETDNQPALAATVLDAMITVMSTANVLNVPLWDIQAADEDLVGVVRGTPQPANLQVIAISYVIAVGKLAKAVEALEQLEAKDSRTAIEKTLCSTWLLLMRFWRAVSDQTISEALKRRMYSLESNSIFYGTYPSYDKDYQVNPDGPGL